MCRLRAVPTLEEVGRSIHPSWLLHPLELQSGEMCSPGAFNTVTTATLQMSGDPDPGLQEILHFLPHSSSLADFN